MTLAGISVLILAYVLSQFFRAFLAVLSPWLIADLGMTKPDLSLASGIWFATFAVMQFAVGVSLDRFGPRRTAALLLGIAGGGGVMLFAGAWSPLAIIVAMGLIGIGCAPVLMASLYIFARTFDAKRFAALTSVFIGIGSLGNIGAASPLASAAATFGWRPVVAAVGLFTMVIAVSIYLTVRDPEQESHGQGQGLKGYLELLRMPVLWLLFPIMMINYGVAAGVRGLWAGPFLADVYSADAAVIGQATLFMALAMAAGSFIYGPLDTVFNTRKWVAFAGGVVSMGAVIYLAMNPQSGIVSVTIAFIILGLAGTSYGVIMAHGKGFFPSHLTGRGITLMNFFSIGGVALLQVVTGRIVAAKSVPGEPTAAYQALFWFYTAALALALVFYVFSRDAKPKT